RWGNGGGGGWGWAWALRISSCSNGFASGRVIILTKPLRLKLRSPHPPMLGRQPDETGWKVFPAPPTPRLLSLKPRSSPGGAFHLCHRRPPTFRNLPLPRPRHRRTGSASRWRSGLAAHCLRWRTSRRPSFLEPTTAKFVWMILAHSGDAADSYDAGPSCVSNLSGLAFGWSDALDALSGRSEPSSD